MICTQIPKKNFHMQIRACQHLWTPIQHETKKFILKIIQVCTKITTHCINFIVPQRHYVLKWGKSFFVRRKLKVSLFGIVLRAENWFSHTSAVKFKVCGKLKQIYNFTVLVRENQLPARRTTPTRLTIGIQRTKKSFVYVRNVFNRASEARLALALKYAFTHLIRNILFHDFKT